MDDINRGIGINEGAESIATLLTKMCLRSEVIEEGKSVRIEIPPTRAGVCVCVCVCARARQYVFVCLFVCVCVCARVAIIPCYRCSTWL